MSSFHTPSPKKRGSEAGILRAPEPIGGFGPTKACPGPRGPVFTNRGGGFNAPNDSPKGDGLGGVGKRTESGSGTGSPKYGSGPSGMGHSGSNYPT